MTLSAEPATAPSALRRARARHPRLARLWRALSGPGPRRALSRALTLLAVVGCLVQPLPPASARAPSPGGGPASTGFAFDRRVGPGNEGRGGGPTAPALTPSTLAESLQGIRIYDHDIDCSAPPGDTVEPSFQYSEEGYYPQVTKVFYICSTTGGTFHISLRAGAQGYGYEQGTDAYIECLSGCSGMLPVHPSMIPLYENGLGCFVWQSSFEEDYYLGPGKYRLYLHAKGGASYGIYCPIPGKIVVSMSISVPSVSDKRCLGVESTCLASTKDVQLFDLHPVNTRTGNFTHQELDFSLPTRGLALEFERSYNSLDTALGPLGRGWTHSYNMRLVTSTYAVTLVAPRGSRLPFYKAPGGVLVPGPGVRATLVQNGGGYTLTQGDRIEYTFDAGGRLASADDGRGNVTTFTYTGANLTAATAPDGRALAFAYDGQGRVTDVTDPLSRTVHYGYTGDNLTSFTDQLERTWTYGYDAQGRMTSVGDPEGHAVVNEYDSQGRVILQRDKLEQPSHMAYYADRTVITDTNGIPITHTYSASGVLMSTTDALGQTTRYEHDANYNIIAVTDALSRTTHYTWNDCGCNIARIEDALGNVTTREYDERNNLLGETDPLTRTTRYAYDAHDNLVAITNTLGYTATFAYGAYGQLLASRDADGHPTRYGYDGYGNVAVITDTLGHTTHMAYDLAGQVTAVTDARQNATWFAYDQAGHVLTMTDALLGRTLYTYDAVGNLTRVVDPLTRPTSLAYDAARRLITTTNALEWQTIRAYDPVGRLARVVDANGNPTSYGYDVVGRLVTVTNALEGRAIYGYDAVGDVTSITDARGKTSYLGYDALNRMVAITDTLGHVARYAYDAVGNRTWELDPSGVLVHYTYDELDRLKTVAGPLGTVLTNAYDRAGNLTSVADGNGHPVRYTYDALDRLHSVLDPLEGETTYDYDPVANLITVTDARRHPTQRVYDALNRLTRVSDPLGHATAYGYDALGNTTVITDADLGVTRLTYDALDRLAGVSYPDSTVSYRYDRVGNRLAMTDTTGVTTYAYDELYRPLTITAPYAGPVSYLYNAVGNRVHTGYPNGAGAGYGYDDAGRLAWVADSQGGLTGYTYDDAGRLKQADLPNGVQSVYGYDAAGRLTSIEHQKAGDWLTRYDYGLDPAANRVAITETTTALKATYAAGLGRPAPGQGVVAGWPEGSLTGQVIRYSYDAYDRLTAAAYSNGDRYGYAYDAVGNRTALTLTVGGVQSRVTAYSYDDADRLTSVDGQPYSYDNRGNLTCDGTWTYSYNGAGRMVRAASVAATHVYTYNGEGLRVAQSIQGQQLAFTWDQAAGLPQVLGTSDGARFLYGLERLGLVRGGDWAYELHDALGSVRQWTDANAAVLGVQAYGPYGEPLTPLGPPLAPWGYTGEWQDPAGLLYLRARWYSKGLGAFTQVDPGPAMRTWPATQHPYLYAVANPLAHVDPTGLQPPVGGPPPSSPNAYRGFTEREERLLAYMLYNEMHWMGVNADLLTPAGKTKLEEAKSMRYRDLWMRVGAWVAVDTAKARKVTLTAELRTENRYDVSVPIITGWYELELWNMARNWAHRVYWRELTGETDPTGGASNFFHADESPPGKCDDPDYTGPKDWVTMQEEYKKVLAKEIIVTIEGKETTIVVEPELPKTWHPIPAFGSIPCWLPHLFFVRPGEVVYPPAPSTGGRE